jgi:ribose transport system substrate-binding protein
MIGPAVGEFAVKTLGGPGQAKGNLVEIWVGFGTQASHDRSNGFHQLVDKEKAIKNEKIDCDWKQNKAYDLMTTLLKANEKIDLVYGHNYPMT